MTDRTTQSAQTILKHYLMRHPELADAAIGKIVQWFKKANSGVRRQISRV